jgi:hypothetical protein
MKDLIGAAILIVGLYGGTKAIEVIHDSIKKAALEKAAQGLPPLPRFTGK